jgi:hypothetical protein
VLLGLVPFAYFRLLHIGRLDLVAGHLRW